MTAGPCGAPGRWLKTSRPGVKMHALPSRVTSQTMVMSSTLTKPASSAKCRLWPSRSAARAIYVCALLVVAVFVVFGQSLFYPFLNFDDSRFVYAEPHVSGGLSSANVAWAFTNGPLGEWYPLTMLSHMLDCQIYGLRPTGHHLTNVLLHAATAVGLFLALWRMTGGLWPSALVAALFALHPLRVESVAWIAERRDVLSGLFFVLTLAAYDEYVRHPRSLLRYAAVVGMLTLGLLSKPMLVTVPGVLLLLDFWPLGRFGGTMPATDRTGNRRPPAFHGERFSTSCPCWRSAGRRPGDLDHP